MCQQSLIYAIEDSIINCSTSVAVIDSSSVTYTFAELGERAACMANYLRNYGVKQGDRVVIFMRRSFDALAAALAIWKLGAVYVPIDPKVPSARIQTIVDEVEPQCIVSDSALLEKITQLHSRILTFQDPDYLLCHVVFDDCVQRDDQDLAYIIYTSGSTGQPKGVMITHDNLAHHVAWLREDFQFTSQDIFSFNSSFAFDFSVTCTLAPLSIGSRIVITGELDALNIGCYCSVLAKHQVTFVKWTPSYFKLLLHYVEQHKPDLSSLRYVMIAGEELLATYLERWFSIYPDHKIVNEYGPTETTVGATVQWVTQKTLDSSLNSVPIGKPIKGTKTFVVDEANQRVQRGDIGELLVGGVGVGLGYYNKPDLTADKFIQPEFFKKRGLAYKTGDLVKELEDGSYLYLGRMDKQVKIRGQRIDLSEIENKILKFPGITEAVVTVDKSQQSDNNILVTYLVTDGKTSFDARALRADLLRHLTEAMVPEKYYRVSYIPMTINGKIDFFRLSNHVKENNKLSCSQHVISHDLIDSIVNVLKKYINLQDVDLYQSLFSLGVTSLLAAQIVTDLNKDVSFALRIQDLFLYSTINDLARFIKTQEDSLYAVMTAQERAFRLSRSMFLEPIAILSMHCLLPEAQTCEALWDLCRQKKEAISFFKKDIKTKKETDSAYSVYAKGVLKDIGHFDADFFNFSPKDAHLSDPQHRLFLEAAWTVLEKAGYAPNNNNDAGRLGVFVSMNDSTYLTDYGVGSSSDHLGNRFVSGRLMSSQFLATKLAYYLNCTGPSIGLQTACSSSLVSIALACQQLSSHQCDMAIAGGVSIMMPQEQSYLYQKNNILSSDGHCRPFDENATGTVFSDGLGVVVVKRLVDALRDNDSIVAVIKGACINNDGSKKMSYTAPSVKGQMTCIQSALDSAGVSPETIGYVEAHGTGTKVGDPIEIEALSKVFRARSNKQQFCALGSLKANMGHAHVAAGVAGLIKAAMVLKNREIPPMLHYVKANAFIDFESSPFYVNTRLQSWPCNKYPRRAGVSAFGVGGTNAHIVLEEAPKPTTYLFNREYAILSFSAKTKCALRDYEKKWLAFLEDKQASLSSHFLADAAYTSQVGRAEFKYRSSIVAKDVKDAIFQLKALRECETRKFIDSQKIKKFAFLFPGQGTQYVNLSRKLYQEEPAYSACLEECLSIASSHVGVDLKNILFSDKKVNLSAEHKLYQTEFTHPILFSVEYALAKLLMHWGIKPACMLGHSLGEYVAACLSSVFSLEDALALVCARGKAISECAEGVMLAVPLSQDKILSVCQEDVNIAAVNAPNFCSISGTASSINKIEKQLHLSFPTESLGVRRLQCSRPFHSKLLQSAVEPFLRVLKSIKRQTPNIPYLSNVTGEWVSESEVKSDQYWVDHMTKAVQFSKAARQLIQYDNMVFLEVGAGTTLLSLVQKHTDSTLCRVSFLPRYDDVREENSHHYVSKALAKLWSYGCPVNWKHYYLHEKRQRIALPTYPFQRKHYWFDQILDHKEAGVSSIGKTQPDLGFYLPTWVRDAERLSIQSLHALKDKKIQWIIFDNQSTFSAFLIERLKSVDANIVLIERGKVFDEKKENRFSLNVFEQSHYNKLIENIALEKEGHCLLLHCWLLDPAVSQVRQELLDDVMLYQGFYSLLFFIQAFSQYNPRAKLSCVTLTTQLHAVSGQEHCDPLKSLVLSFPRVLPLENKNINLCNIDLDEQLSSKTDALYASNVIMRALQMLNVNDKKVACHNDLAFRHGYSWHPAYQALPLNEKASQDSLLIENNSAYLITGGLGGMGLTVADWLSQKAEVTLILVARTSFPAQKSWGAFLEECDESHPHSAKIQVLQKIVSRGSRVVIECGDVADYTVMRAIVQRVKRQNIEIKGVFHLAGVPGEGMGLSKSPEVVRSVLSAKLQGTWVLARLFRLHPLDFVVCASSLTAIAGGVGQLDYCAANIFVDHFIAKAPFKNCKQQLTINWNAWTQVGMAASVNDSKTHQVLYKGNSIAPEKGVAVLNMLLNTHHAQAIVSRFHPVEEIKRIEDTFKSAPKNEPMLKSGHTSSMVSIHEAMRLIWQDILGVDVIHENDTFYGLGGDSLSVIQLIEQCERRLNVTIDLQHLSHAKTLTDMVTLIEYQPVNSPDIIVPLSSYSDDQSNKNIYFIHPLGGTVLCYLPLAPNLPADLSYYGIQDPDCIQHNMQKLTGISGMATCYSKAIVNHQAKSIVLVGYSFGGNVAMEMVASLQGQGVIVERVILIDSWVRPSAPSDTTALDTESMRVIKRYYGVESWQYRRVEERLSWLRDYKPSNVDVPVILLRAQDLLPLYKKIGANKHGWEPYCQASLSYHDVEGSHDTLLKQPYLRGFCQLLKKLIA